MLSVQCVSILASVYRDGGLKPVSGKQFMVQVGRSGNGSLFPFRLGSCELLPRPWYEPPAPCLPPVSHLHPASVSTLLSPRNPLSTHAKMAGLAGGLVPERAGIRTDTPRVGGCDVDGPSCGHSSRPKRAVFYPVAARVHLVIFRICPKQYLFPCTLSAFAVTTLPISRSPTSTPLCNSC